MDDFLSDEQIEYAVTCLIQLVEFRKLSQTQLHQTSGVSQGTISKVLTRAQPPSPEVLKKLYQAMGLKLDDILHDTEAVVPIGRGDHTHPVHNPDFSAQQVYLTDRSRSSTFDYIILFVPLQATASGKRMRSRRRLECRASGWCQTAFPG